MCKPPIICGGMRFSIQNMDMSQLGRYAGPPAASIRFPDMTSQSSAERPIQAILLMNLAVFIFTAMDGVIKSVSDLYPTGELVFARF